MAKLNLKKPLVVFDLETTGVNVVTDRIVEISIIKIMQNHEREVFTKRINPEIPIPKEASMVHGIYDEDVKNSPRFRSVAKTVYDFIEGCDLAGFNIIKFDIPLLAEEFIRARIDFNFHKVNVLDAQKIFHLMEKRTLSAAYKFYCNKDLENAHSSMADSLATLEVIEAQIEKYKGKSVLDNKGNHLCDIENDISVLKPLGFPDNMIDFSGRIVYNENKIPVFNFGKYKGQSIKNILTRDPSYYDWILKNAFAEDTKKKIIKYRLSMVKI